MKRRARQRGRFPNAAAVIRLVAAVLADTHDAWPAGDRRHLSDGAMATRSPARDTDPIAERNPGD